MTTPRRMSALALQRFGAAAVPAIRVHVGDSWSDVVVLRWQHWGCDLRIGLLGLAALALATAVWLLLWRRFARRKVGGWDTTKVTVRYGDLLEQEIEPNRDTVRIAYQAWVEIVTRKVGIPLVDEDVIVEVYDSWHELFGILRELSKGVPAHRLREDEDTRRLVDVLHRVLNEGMRPHLTKWQAGFRRWYQAECDKAENQGKSPNEIQRSYPQYDELVSELRELNGEFVSFAQTLRVLAEGNQ